MDLTHNKSFMTQKQTICGKKQLIMINYLAWLVGHSECAHHVDSTCVSRRCFVIHSTFSFSSSFRFWTSSST